MDETNKTAAADFGSLEERVLARIGAQRKGKSVLISTPQMQAGEQFMQAFMGQAAKLGTMIHDELILGVDEAQYLNMPHQEPRGKQPWQKGYFPKQGKPAVMPPRQIAGWHARTNEKAQHEYRRWGSSLVVIGSPFIGWTVARESWMDDDVVLSRFPKLRTALTWASLQQANEEEPQVGKGGGSKTARQAAKVRWLGMQYGIGPDRFKAQLQTDIYKDLARYCKEDVDRSKP